MDKGITRKGMSVPRNEPLKNKESYCQSWELVDLKDIRECNHTVKLHEDKDIKSAIEWLKEEINKLKVENFLVLCDVYELIDKAFEDIIK